MHEILIFSFKWQIHIGTTNTDQQLTLSQTKFRGSLGRPLVVDKNTLGIPNQT